MGQNHEISVVGYDNVTSSYLVRNSWGEYWGELGYIRLGPMGSDPLGLESSGCAWATPDVWTEQNFPCNEDGSNCVKKQDKSYGQWEDPAVSGKLYAHGL